MRIIALLGLLLAMTAAPAQAAPIRCGTPTVSTFLTSTDWYENLEFDKGTLWLSNLSGNRIEQYRLDGTQIQHHNLRAPGAIRKGPDGVLHVNFGNDSPETRDQPSGVVRLTPKPEVWIGGDTLSSANGAEFDARGHLYVSDPFTGLYEFDRQGSLVRHIDLAYPNGIVTIGNTVFTNILIDPKSAIVRITGNRQTRIELGAPDKGLDDLAVGPDGKLYVTTYTSGELIKVDPWTGAHCVLMSGLKNPTAARFLPGTRTMFVTQASGTVLKVRL
ncbi:SMP-30/gluconolactonase/LRE family protein [Lentzea sp. NPDC051213]|uniref:SMP-30/gluconolactonase/LRE family protein n=1 Tax=Lentzea sp. NPDC051213 TaxID=3364126 RepID=UPI00379F5B0E